MNHDPKLTPELLAPGTSILQRHNPASAPVALTDNASSVFTDFHYIRPFAIGAGANLDQINAKMIACGVRLLFVIDAGDELQGLVTYTDLFGEKPVRYIQEHGGTRVEILAQDIMTPLAQLEALAHAAVLKASVGDIVETIKTAGRQHLLVCAGAGGKQVIVGLFSSTQIEKLLGMKIEISARANTFADIERALA